jgi:hypothetical protein
MSFLDNSGDIILDAVLTDAGRERLARGDGSFKITKFALGDDEINYELYNPNDSRGSAFYDLEILQSPVLEAFTNNTSTMKSKLITITRTNILYLPIVKYNGEKGEKGFALNENSLANGSLPIGVDVATMSTDPADGTARLNTRAYNGVSSVSTPLVFDQGLDTTEIVPSVTIPTDLFETQYSIEMDNRLMSLTTPTGATVITPSFVDDDSIASYSVSDGTSFVEDISSLDSEADSNIAGPRGSRLKLGLRVSIDLQSGTYLFTTLGSEVSYLGKTYYFIDTTVRVVGLTTGYRIDLPVRLLKWKSTP